MTDAISSAAGTTAAESARRAADAQRAQQVAQTAQAEQAQQQQLQQQQRLSGADQAAHTRDVVAGAAFENEARGLTGSRSYGSGSARPGAPPMPSGSEPATAMAASARPTMRPHKQPPQQRPTHPRAPREAGPEQPLEPSPTTKPGETDPTTANPNRPPNQAPAARDVHIALNQTERAGDAAREMARRAGVDPRQVHVTGHENRTIESRAQLIEEARAAGRTPRGWDGKPIPPEADARETARDEVMSKRFGSRENWDRVKQSWETMPQAERDEVAPANDPGKLERRTILESIFDRGRRFRPR